MMKERIFMKWFGGSLAMVALIGLAGSGSAAAATALDSLMDEGISYECAAPQKKFTVSHENRANMEAMLTEGMGYADCVVGADQIIIKLDHQQMLRQDMEACSCEDPATLVAASK